MGYLKKIEEISDKKGKDVEEVLTEPFHSLYKKYSILIKDESKK